MGSKIPERTNSHFDFNSSCHPDHLYVYNSISILISFRLCAHPWEEGFEYCRFHYFSPLLWHLSQRITAVYERHDQVSFRNLTWCRRCFSVVRVLGVHPLGYVSALSSFQGCLRVPFCRTLPFFSDVLLYTICKCWIRSTAPIACGPAVFLSPLGPKPTNSSSFKLDLPSSLLHIPTAALYRAFTFKPFLLGFFRGPLLLPVLVASVTFSGERRSSSFFSALMLTALS